MTTVAIAQFLPNVLPYVRDCPDAVAIGAIRDALIEFCNQTHWWSEKLDNISTQVNVSIYELDIPLDAELVMVESMRVAGRPVRPVTHEGLNSRYGYTDWNTLVGQPAYYVLTLPGEIQLVPKPQETTALGLETIVSLRPTRDAAYVTDTIYNRWAEQIGYGARARLQMVPSQSYSDPGAANAHAMMFNKAVAEARAEKHRSLTRGPAYVQRRRWV